MSGTKQKTICEGCVWRLETGDSRKVLCPFSICRREELRPMWRKERDGPAGQRPVSMVRRVSRDAEDSVPYGQGDRKKS